MKRYFLKAFQGVMAFLLVAAVCPTQAVAGAIYEYVQDDGAKAFTDDLSKVPPKYRDKAKLVDDAALPPLGVLKTDDGSATDKALSAVVDLGWKAWAAGGGALAVVIAIAVVLHRRKKRYEDQKRLLHDQIGKIRKH